LKDVQSAALIPLLLQGAAIYWYDQQEDGVKKDVERLLDALQKQFAPSQAIAWKKHSSIWTRNQSASETAEQYIIDLSKQAAALHLDDSEVIHAALRGIRRELRSFVVQKNPTTVADLIAAAKLAEATVEPGETSSFDVVMDAIKRLEKRFETTSINSADRRAERYSESQDRPSGRQRSPSPYHRYGERDQNRVRFRDEQSPPQSPSRSSSRDRPSSHRRSDQTQDNRSRRSVYYRQSPSSNCRNCHQSHGNVICYSCGMRGHVKDCCLRRINTRQFRNE